MRSAFEAALSECKEKIQTSKIIIKRGKDRGTVNREGIANVHK